MQDHAQSPVPASQPFEAGAEGLPARSVEPWAEAGRALEAKYGDLAWLHAPTRLFNYPPDDADL